MSRPEQLQAATRKPSSAGKPAVIRVMEGSTMRQRTYDRSKRTRRDRFLRGW